MYEHFRIISAVINLVICTGIVFSYSQRFRRFRFPYLADLRRYMIFYGILLFLYILTKYFDLNISDTVIQARQPFLADAALLVAVYLYGAMVYQINGVYRYFSARKGRNLFSWLILAGLACAAAYMLLVHAVNAQHAALPRVLIGLSFGLPGVSEFGIYRGLIKSEREQESAAHLSRSLGWYMLSRYIVMIVIFLLIGLFAKWTIPETIAPFAAFAVLLVMTAAPGIWLEKKFMPAATSMSALVDSENSVSLFCGLHHLSRREEEIVRLIFDGKSNQEIEETLFISYHTVKNHLYNIYRKLGIKSRFELVHLITRFREERQ